MSEELCNANLKDGKVCNRPAGWMTDHLGEGKCYEHGGLRPPSADIFRNAIERHGLGGLMDLAETLSYDEAEYLEHVSSAALTTLRAKVIAQMMDEGRSPKEQSELALTLRRVEASINALKDGKPLGLVDPDVIEASERDEAERSRLTVLAEKFGS